MSYDLEKILTRASDDLERQTRGKTASESLEAYRRFRRLEEHRLRLRISSGAGGREVVRQRSDLVDILFLRLFLHLFLPRPRDTLPPHGHFFQCANLLPGPNFFLPVEFNHLLSSP